MLGPMSRESGDHVAYFTDVRSLFTPLHPPGTLQSNLPLESFKGRVDPKIAAVAAAKQNAERARIADARAALPPVETILGIDEFEASCIDQTASRPKLTST